MPRQPIAMEIEAKSLSSVAFLVLCSLSLTWSLPVPRLVYQQSAPNPYPQPQYWELRPAAMEPFMASDAQTALFHSYIQQSRFDPDRPYIQMVVPNNDEDTGASEDRYFPFAVRPTRPPVKTTTPPPEICKNESTNATEINGTAVNRNVTENCNPPVTGTDERPATALFMLADGTTLYSVGQGDAKPESPLNGAYELAYVARRPAARKLSPYPMVQYADYNQMNRDRLPFFGSPYAAAAYYEPVYIYKPVYPSSSRSYDVYYYLPTEEQEPDANSEAESQPEATKEEDEETERIREESSEEIARTEFLARDPAPSAEKEEASEIAMADAGGADDQETLQQEALLNALSSEIEAELQTTTTAAQSAAQSSPEKEDPITKEAKHELAQLLDHNDNRDYWENELERISNKDLINAVEVVLQQLNSRLSDKQ